MSIAEIRGAVGGCKEVKMVERLLRLRELADEWGCSLSSIKRAVDSGMLKVVVVGKRSIRVPASEVDRFVQEGLTTRMDRRWRGDGDDKGKEV